MKFDILKVSWFELLVCKHQQTFFKKKKKTGKCLLFFPLEKLNKTYKYLMSFSWTFPERIFIYAETEHREVTTSDGLETVHNAIAE